MTLLLVPSLAGSFFLVKTLLMVFGHTEDTGYSAGQRVIRSWFRLSRWTWAQARGWDAFLIHFWRALSARRMQIELVMREPLPNLSTPVGDKEMAGIF